MTYEEWLADSANKLKNSDINTARLDAILLLEHCLGLGRTHILAHPETILKKVEFNRLEKLLKRRVSGEPMAYILGKKEFYGREFIVTPDVLIPRPDSETIIELLKKHRSCKDNPCNRDYPCKVLDVGTGSGCLAISAKLELPEIEVTACDISAKVLGVAKKNATNLKANIKFVQSDLLTNIYEKFDIILANLPYVPENFDVSNDVKHEPYLALYSGKDGLDAIKEFFKQLPKKVNQGALVFMESLTSQHLDIENIAQNHNFELVETSALTQVYKYLD